jgi:iron complex transport system permease protein
VVGVASGAALGAVAYLVLGGPLAAALPTLAPYLLALAAFVGALATTATVVGAAGDLGRRSAGGLVLGGVAVGALASAGTGLLVSIADDAQLRSITFWTLGSLAGASWTALGVVAPAVVASIAALVVTAPALDRLLLGEAEARHLGLDVARLRRRVIAAVALGVGAAVAACGVVGFVGLIVPHVLRGWLGPRHRALLVASAPGGALLVVLADLVARTATPTELPIGILTALVGAPVLLAMVRRRELAA